MKQLMEEKEGYYFEIRFNPETQEMRTDAKIPLGQMARGIGSTLSKLDLTREDFESFLLQLVKEFKANNEYKESKDE